MFQKYSGTFFAVLSVIATPFLTTWAGLTEGCTQEVIAQASVGLAILVARYLKGDVNVVGVRE